MKQFSTNACARNARVHPNKFNALLLVLSVGMMSLINHVAIGQTTNEQTIKGIVRSGEDNLPLVGTSIYLKKSGEGTTSNSDGTFEFPKKLKAGEVLIFSYIGFEVKEVTIAADMSEPLQITLTPTAIEVMGDANSNEVFAAKRKGLRKLLPTKK